MTTRTKKCKSPYESIRAVQTVSGIMTGFILLAEMSETLYTLWAQKAVFYSLAVSLLKVTLHDLEIICGSFPTYVTEAYLYYRRTSYMYFQICAPMREKQCLETSSKVTENCHLNKPS